MGKGDPCPLTVSQNNRWLNLPMLSLHNRRLLVIKPRLRFWCVVIIHLSLTLFDTFLAIMIWLVISHNRFSFASTHLCPICEKGNRLKPVYFRERAIAV